MTNDNLTAELESLVSVDPRYKVEAYLFVINGLEYTLAKLRRSGHVSGRELAEGLRDYARAKFGPTARMVLDHWGIRRTDDFGCMVFNMIDRGILGKTEQDSLDDFRDVYDFDEAFEKGYDWKIERDFGR
ncbi:MAG TPA: Minf_1886 family protein [bacterium]|nr:Minf_1886 family protein [bacterium]